MFACYALSFTRFNIYIFCANIILKSRVAELFLDQAACLDAKGESRYITKQE
jgi:hypothetical protein